MKALIVYPDGRKEALGLPDREERLEALQGVLGGCIAYFPEAFHELNHWEVVHLDDWFGRPVNHEAGRMIGLPAECEPLQGPVMLLRLPEGHTNRAERKHQRQYFGMLNAVDSGFCTAAEAGIGALIRVDAA